MDLSVIWWRSVIQWIYGMCCYKNYQVSGGRLVIHCHASCRLLHDTHWLGHSFFQGYNKLKDFIRHITNLHWYITKHLHCTVFLQHASTPHWATGTQFSALHVSWKVNWPEATNILAYSLKATMCNSQIRTVCPIIIKIRAIFHDISMQLWKIWNLQNLCLRAL